MLEFPSFLRLNSIPLHVYTTFFYPSYEHQGCFHFLAIVHNAAMNMGAQWTVWVCAFICLGYRPRRAFLDHMGILCLIFEASPYCFPQHLHRFTFLSAGLKGSNFSTPSTLLCLHECARSLSRSLFLFFPLPLLYSFFSSFFLIFILMCVKYYLTVVLNHLYNKFLKSIF